MPSFPDLPEPLTDGAVALRLADERDIPEILIAYQDDPEMHLRLGEDRPPSGADLGRRSEHAEASRASGASVALTVLLQGSDVCRGQVFTSAVDWQNERAELAIWLAPQVRGQGVASRALRLASGWLLARCGLERVQLLSEPDNEPLLRAAAAACFVREGLLRGHIRVRKQRIDCAVLSLLPADLEG